MANLTLLAVATALPELFVSCLSVFSAAQGSVPAELGPMAIAGSASFNLLVVAGMAVAYASQLTAVTQTNTFLLSGLFSAVACIWLFTVLTITSAGYITLTEALTTLLFYPVFLFLAHTVDFFSSKKEVDLNESRRQICRHALQCIAEEHGA